MTGKELEGGSTMLIVNCFLIWVRLHTFSACDHLLSITSIIQVSVSKQISATCTVFGEMLAWIPLSRQMSKIKRYQESSSTRITVCLCNSYQLLYKKLPSPPKHSGLKEQTFIISQLVRVRNSGARQLGRSGLESHMRFQLRCWQDLQAFEGLTRSYRIQFQHDSFTWSLAGGLSPLPRGSLHRAA